MFSVGRGMKDSFAPLSIIPHTVFTYPTDRARAQFGWVGRKEGSKGESQTRLG